MPGEQKSSLSFAEPGEEIILERLLLYLDDGHVKAQLPEPALKAAYYAFIALIKLRLLGAYGIQGDNFTEPFGEGGKRHLFLRFIVDNYAI